MMVVEWELAGWYSERINKWKRVLQRTFANVYKTCVCLCEVVCYCCKTGPSSMRKRRRIIDMSAVSRVQRGWPDPDRAFSLPQSIGHLSFLSHSLSCHFVPHCISILIIIQFKEPRNDAQPLRNNFQILTVKENESFSQFFPIYAPTLWKRWCIMSFRSTRTCRYAIVLLDGKNRCGKTGRRCNCIYVHSVAAFLSLSLSAHMVVCVYMCVLSLVICARFPQSDMSIVPL